MRFEKTIKDVIRDYNRNNECSLNYEVFGKAFANSISSYEMEIGDAYALCMECIYYLNEMDVSMDDEDKDDMESILKDFFSQDLDNLLEYAEPYKWIPQVLEKVLKQSYLIFEEAKEFYFMFGVVDKSYNVDELFFQMTDARKELDSLEYIYRSYNEIIDIYERELSESQLDIDTIKGNKLLLSLRMADYIENSGMDTMSEDVDFSGETPFSMPDKLFQ